MLVGVVPPPVHGQSLVTQALFETDLSPCEKIRVPIRSSKTLTTVGRFSVEKALGLIGLIAKVYYLWIFKRPKVLYYTAGSGAWVPFARDVLFLTFCRPLFSKTLIHYHSGNLVEFIAASSLRSIIARFIYGRGAWTIRLGTSCPAPSYPSNRIFDVPNGINAPENLPAKTASSAFRILFLGNLFEDKGVLDLIEAVRIFANERPDPIRLSLVGGWPNQNTQQKIEAAIATLPSNVTCPPPAPAYGAEKWKALATHDVFVFPSYYSSENLPLVAIEAMAASLPIIATTWRGLPSLVDDGVTGFHVAINSPGQISEHLKTLISSKETREQMGAKARERYEHNFTLQLHTETIRNVIWEATGLKDKRSDQSSSHKLMQ